MEIIIASCDSTFKHWWYHIIKSKLSHFLAMHTLMNLCYTILAGNIFFLAFRINLFSFFLYIFFSTFVSKFDSHLFNAFWVKVLSAFSYAFNCGLWLITPTAYFCIRLWMWYNLHLIHYLLLLLTLIIARRLTIISRIFSFVSICFLFSFISWLFVHISHRHSALLSLAAAINRIVWILWHLIWIRHAAGRSLMIAWGRWRGWLLTWHVISLRLGIKIG